MFKIKVLMKYILDLLAALTALSFLHLTNDREPLASKFDYSF